MRSPLGSVESWVGRPRSVLGDAARILSIAIDIFGKDSAHLIVQKAFEVKRSNRSIIAMVVNRLNMVAQPDAQPHSTRLNSLGSLAK